MRRAGEETDFRSRYDIVYFNFCVHSFNDNYNTLI
jgi:hypothetical protein